MAIRQYIGSRYVPKFSDVNGGVWDDTYTYEPLTIVRHGNDYYTSKKEVPTGIDITNTEYWILTGNYNGAISTLSDRVDDMETQVAASAEAIDNLQDAVAENTEAIENITNKFKKVIIIGDSYSVQYDNTLPKQIMANLNIPEADYFISALGSTGFARESDNKKFLDLLMDAENHFDNNEVSHIIVIGGANDSLKTDIEISTAIASFISYANTTFPNAEILYGFIGATTISNNIREFARACLCYKANENPSKRFKYLRNVEYIYHNRKYIQSDQVHPTESGYTEGARQIAIAILNGECDVNYFYTSQSDSSAVYKRAVFESVHNGLASIWVNNFDEIVYPSGSRPSIPSYDDLILDIRDLTGNIITGSYFQDCGTTIAAYMYYDNGSSSTVYPFEIYLYNGILKMRTSKAATGAAIDNINYIRVPYFNIQFNTLYC